MRRFAKFVACFVLIAAVVPGVAEFAIAQPAGVTADFAVPRMGSKWSVRITDSVHGTVKEEQRTVMPVDYKGASRIGISNGAKLFILDPATRNMIAIVANGKEEATFDPHTGNWLWPLWVGKTWQPRYASTDFVTGRSWPAVQPTRTVEAYEDVTVPAGTFKAFRVRSSPGLFYYNTSIDWYAPEVRLTVKNVYQGNSVRGTSFVTTEMLTKPH